MARYIVQKRFRTTIQVAGDLINFAVAKGDELELTDAERDALLRDVEGAVKAKPKAKVRTKTGAGKKGQTRQVAAPPETG